LSTPQQRTKIGAASKRGKMRVVAGSTYAKELMDDSPGKKEKLYAVTRKARELTEMPNAQNVQIGKKRERCRRRKKYLPLH